MGFAAPHWVKLHRTNPLECLKRVVKRRTERVGITPNEAAARLTVPILIRAE